MLPRQRWFLVAPLLLGCIGLPELAAGENIVPVIKDGGKLFSSEGLEQGNKKVRAIYQQYGKDVQVETFASIPDDLKADAKKQGEEEFFVSWAKQRQKEFDVQGIYMLICRSPGYVEVIIDKATRAKAFTPDDRKKLIPRVLKKFKERDNPRRFDDGLLEALRFIDSTFESHGVHKQEVKKEAPADNDERHAPGRTAPAHPGGGGIGSSLLSWVCIGLVVLLVVWLLFGLIRAFTGAGRGGYGGGGPSYGGGGYGGGYGPGYGGGGGGGFFSSLLGGMFGAAAGSWMYDSFFRGSHSGGSDWGSNPQAFGGGGGGGGDVPAAEPGAGDFSDDTGGGGSFDDAGGSDDRGGGGFDDGGGGFDDGGGGGFDSGGGGFDSGGTDFGGGGFDDGGGGGFDSGGGDF